ncbi:MAG: hypothetical protein ACE5FY_05950 [Nitrospiria bacterium]
MLDKEILEGTYYLSPEVSDLLDQFQMIANGEQKSKPKLQGVGEGRKVKATFMVSLEIDALLERLQRESRIKGDKKSKGWFIDQALIAYMKTNNLPEILQEARDESRYHRIKSWSIKQALEMKYSPEIFSI